MGTKSGPDRRVQSYDWTQRYASAYMDLSHNTYFEHAATFEAMAARVGELAQDLAEKGCIIASVSHAIDDSDPKGRVQFIVVGRSIAT